MVIDNLSCPTIIKNYCVSFYGNENRYICSIPIRNLFTINIYHSPMHPLCSVEGNCFRILANPDTIDIESDLALIAVVGRGMKSTRGTAGRIFSALAHKNINVKMIDQGSSELNIIIGVANDDFETAIKAIYDIFVITRL